MQFTLNPLNRRRPPWFQAIASIPRRKSAVPYVCEFSDDTVSQSLDLVWNFRCLAMTMLHPWRTVLKLDHAGPPRSSLVFGIVRVPINVEFFMIAKGYRGVILIVVSCLG
jgi:hypothetical protein